MSYITSPPHARRSRWRPEALHATHMTAEPKPMLAVCYYGEFDPFSGSVDRRYACLDDVVHVLAMLCLLYDVVIVPPGALLEHPLGLPAFERLAPFVREGMLGTTASPPDPGPRTYMKERLQRRVEGRLHRRSGSLKPSGVIELQNRLSDILPAQWTITRDVARQISGCAEHIRRFCETTAGTMAAARQVLAMMHATSQQRGTPLQRDELLARLAVLRGEVPPHELSIMAFAIQASYFSFGSRGHVPEGADIPDRACTLFPGRFAHLLQRHATHMPGLELPPYDRSAAPAMVRARMRRLGLDLDAITGLPPRALLEIAGDDGFATDDVMQLLLELDLLRGAITSGPCGAWSAVGQAKKRRQESLENRVHVEKNRVNHALAPSGLMIDLANNGKWRLVDVRGERVVPRIEGTVWNHAPPRPPEPAPPGLSPNQQRIWRALLAAFPHYLSTHALAATLESGGCTPARVAAVVHKLGGVLDRSGAPMRLARTQPGLYRLRMARPVGGDTK